jgi:hypothetical protein
MPIVCSYKLSFAIGVVWLGSCPAWCQSGSPGLATALNIRIHIFNLANVPEGTLEPAVAVATGIFATAGLGTTWQQGAADAAEAHTIELANDAAIALGKPDIRNYVVLRIVRGVPAGAFPGALGFALPHARAGVHVTIFYDRIELLMHSVAASVPRILGHAMAHEIGHILLGSSEHSSTGIMKGRWGKMDWQRAAVDLLRFDPEQTDVVGASAMRRWESAP